MGRRKREPMSEGKKNIIGMLLEEYDIKSAKDIEEALKDLLGGTIQEMLESEMDEHLGYHEYERSDNPDYSRSGNIVFITVFDFTEIFSQSHLFTQISHYPPATK